MFPSREQASFLRYELLVDREALAPLPGRVAEAPAVYRPRHPECTGFYRVVHEHLDRYLGTYEDRTLPKLAVRSPGSASRS